MISSPLNQAPAETRRDRARSGWYGCRLAPAEDQACDTQAFWRIFHIQSTTDTVSIYNNC
jgi:hypothetical protein